MRFLVAAIFVLALSACSSTAPYEHSKKTHENAVEYHVGSLQINGDSHKVPSVVTLTFDVDPSGYIKNLSVYGATPAGVRRVKQALAEIGRLPPHTEPEAIRYSTQVIFP